MKLNLIVSLWFILSLLSCDTLFKKQNEEPPIARVHDKYLFLDDINDILKPGISKEDSAFIVNNYVDRWIRTQIMVTKAEENLTEEDRV